MIHYTCDRCKRLIDAEHDLRYTLRMEIQAAVDPVDPDESDDDRDHLLEVQEILERMEDDQSDEIGLDIYERSRYDLCSECYQDFVKNPLGQKESLPLGFSNN